MVNPAAQVLMLKLAIGMQIKLVLMKNRQRPARKSRGFAEGFTLIEILVVILIISITLTFAMLSFGDFGQKRKILATAQQFANYVKLVKEQAIIESSTLGIRINQNGYEVLRLQESNQWQPMPQSIFHAHTFPKQIKSLFKTKNKKNNQWIIFSATGDMTPFELKLGTSEEQNIVTLIGYTNGLIKLRTADEK